MGAALEIKYSQEQEAPIKASPRPVEDSSVGTHPLTASMPVSSHSGSIIINMEDGHATRSQASYMYGGRASAQSVANVENKKSVLSDTMSVHSGVPVSAEGSHLTDSKELNQGVVYGAGNIKGVAKGMPVAAAVTLQIPELPGRPVHSQPLKDSANDSVSVKSQSQKPM